MIFARDIVTILLSGIVLIFIAGYSIARCKETISTPYRSRANFLFQGLRPIDSLASNMGGAFSLTYLGATAIYAHLYGLIFLVYLCVGFLLAAVIATRLVLYFGDRARQRSPLLLLLRACYGKRNSQRLATLYTIIYFALLVEEIAVSRVVLNLVIPQSRIVSSALLATLLLVIIVYLSWGGYKAVLISDFAQLKLLLLFLLVLLFTLTARNPIALDLSQFSKAPASNGGVPLVLGLVLFVPWLSAAPDFYARLNYHQVEHAQLGRRQFITVSFILMFIVYGSVALLGASLPRAFAHDQTPTGFAAAGVKIIGSSVSTIGTVVFFASIFCMMFTTVDTLLVTYLQCAYFSSFTSRWTQRVDSMMILAAALAGLLVPADSVSVVGLFIGGLLILPALPITAIAVPALRRVLPRNQLYLLFAAPLCSLTLLMCLNKLETDFLGHHLIGLLILAPTLVCATLAKSWELLRRKGQ